MRRRSPPSPLSSLSIRRVSGGLEERRDRDRDREREKDRASLTTAASAYKDDGFVNYGAHGDDSLHSDARRSRSRPARWLVVPRNFLLLLLACIPHRG